MRTFTLQGFLIFPENINTVSIAFSKIIASISSNSYHLVISSMSWVRVEIHRNFAVYFSADVIGHPSVDYSVVRCPARESFWEKRTYWLSRYSGSLTTKPLQMPLPFACPTSLWPSPNLPIWLTWNTFITKYVLSTYYVLSIHLGTRNSGKKSCLQGTYILVKEIY